MTRRSPTIARQESGFTLIELLVSLVVLAVAATLLLEGMMSAGLLAQRTNQREVAGAQVAAAQNILRSRLERVRVVTRPDRVTPTLDLGGDETMVDFYAAPPPGAGPDAVQRYRLLRTAPGDLVLYRTSALNDRIDPREKTIVGWTPAILLSGVASLAIAYFGRVAPDREARWHAFWADQARAPQIIRVRIAFAQGDRRVWPDLEIRPASTLDLACDPESMTACKGST